jgi:UDP-N-acetylglucosamine 2-epimerase (non-hydrolysing)
MLAGGEVACAGHARAHEALVVAEVEVGLGAVVGDEHLAVLERAHRARIDVDVGVELDHRDLEAAGLEDRAERGRGDALAQRGHDAAGDENCGVALAHVEAGLRTSNPLRPFPEEPFRRRIAPIARWHFAPTTGARQHLLDEGVAADRVHVVGNTIVDELRRAIATPRATATDWRARGAQLLVLTLHRRETYGQALVAVCVTMLELLERHEDLVLVCPVHPNPAVGLRVRRLLGAHPRCLLVAPMGYRDFVQLLGDARLVVTDSGGIQEEAPYLGVPVLVAREATERPEALRAGAVELVGHDHDRLIHAALRLLTAPRPTPVAFDANAPFGDGDSAPRILDLLMTSHHAESR